MEKKQTNEFVTIPAKYAPYLICPNNVAEHILDTKFITTDGERVILDPICTWFGESESNLKSLDNNCRHYLGLNLAQVKSIWRSRIGRLDTCWHLIKMCKI